MEVFLIVFLVVWALVPYFLNKLYPGKRWIGIVLSFYFGTAHLYISGGIKYVILSCAIYAIIKILTHSDMWAYVVAMPIQTGLMYYRFSKLRSLEQAN